MPKLNPRQRKSLTKLIEAPPCGCHIKKRQLCVSRVSPDGCQDRQDNGSCDCPWVHGPPCEHILQHSMVFGSIDKLQMFLELSSPKDYSDRPAPPDRTPAIGREARVSLMAMRVRSGYRPKADQEIDMGMDISIQGVKIRNGTPWEGEHVCDCMESSAEEDSIRDEIMADLAAMRMERMGRWKS